MNYGAISQTWEDPEFVSPETGFGGDNDPIDVLQVSHTNNLGGRCGIRSYIIHVCVFTFVESYTADCGLFFWGFQLNAKPCKVGEVMSVRVVGCLALVDDDETDWKLLVVDTT